MSCRSAASKGPHAVYPVLNCYVQVFDRPDNAHRRGLINNVKGHCDAGDETLLRALKPGAYDEEADAFGWHGIHTRNSMRPDVSQLSAGRQRLDELFHLSRGWSSEFAMQKLPVALILADSLARVALGGVNADEHSIRTLSQRFRPDCCERRFDRFAIRAGCHQALSQSLQGM